MTDTRLFAAMLRAVLNLEHWPTDVLEREVQRLLDIAGLELAPAGAGDALAAALEREKDAAGDDDPDPGFPPINWPRQAQMAKERNARAAGLIDPPAGVARVFHVEPPPRLLRFEDGSTLDPATFPPDPRVEMDARTRRVSAGLEAPPAGVVTTFAAVPEAAMPRCPTCDHLEHGTAVCGTRVPLGWADAVDARVPDTCQCDG